MNRKNAAASGSPVWHNREWWRITEYRTKVTEQSKKKKSTMKCRRK